VINTYNDLPDKKNRWGKCNTRWCAILIRHILEQISHLAKPEDKESWHIETFNEIFTDYLCHKYRLDPDDQSLALIWSTVPNKTMIRWEAVNPKTASVRATRLAASRQRVREQSGQAEMNRLSFPSFPNFGPKMRDFFFVNIATMVTKRLRSDETVWTAPLSYIIAGRIYHYVIGMKPASTATDVANFARTVSFGGPEPRHLFDGERWHEQMVQVCKTLHGYKKNDHVKYLQIKTVCCHGRETWYQGDGTHLRLFMASREEESKMREYISQREYRQAIRLAETGVLTGEFLCHLATLRCSYNLACLSTTNPTDPKTWVKRHIDNKESVPMQRQSNNN
jgi:hypothetical protein